jgi:hypothetical protein
MSWNFGWNAIAALALSAILTTGELASAQDAQTVPGASDLAGALSQHHGYLFDSQRQLALDGLNRTLRETEWAMKRGETESARVEAAETHALYAAGLIKFLDATPTLIDVSLPAAPGALPRPGPVELPGDSGALLLRVGADAGNPACIVTELDFAGGLSDVWVDDIDPARTTYALISLKNVPATNASIRVIFKSTAGESYQLPVDLVTPELGRLKLTVLSDDTGKEAPAMVRLVWKTNNSEYKPSNALDFTSELDTQSSQSTGLRRVNLLGKLAGTYWCVPGPIDMSLPPGDWEVVIRRGGEHVPVIDTFAVAPGGTVERTYRPKRWVDMRAWGWYSGDDHIHFQILSDFDAQQLMTWLKAEDVHLGNVLKMGDIYRTWFEQRGFGPDYHVQEDDYFLVPGQECPRTHDQLGHTVSLNITDMVRDSSRYYQYDWVFENVMKQGGLSGFAHISHGSFHVHRGMTLTAPKGLIDFVELLQFATLNTDLYYDFLNLGFKVTASAGSDVPWGGTIGEVRVYAYTGDGEFTADKWFDALERGRTFVTNGPMINFRVDDAYPGDELSVDAGQRVRVRARALGAKGFTTPLELQIVQHGKVIRSVRAPAGGTENLEIDMEVDPGDGCWLAAHVVGTEGYRAHTTPVYVVRDGLRFWKYDEVEALLAKRIASLDEIDGMVTDALTRQARGKIGGDKVIEELALQAEALRESVEEARQSYEKLRDTHVQEAPSRN